MMLVSKPDIKTLSALGTFLVLNFSLLFYLLFTQFDEEKTPIYIYLIIFLLLAVGLTVLIKVIRGYKTLSIDKQKIKVKYTLLFRNLQFKLSELDFWEETIIQTKKKPFRELKLRFTQGNTVKITNQENTNYDKVFQYMKRNAQKKEKIT